MEIKGNEGSFISFQTAEKWIAAYKSSPNKGTITSITYGVEQIKQLLTVQGCVGFRVYNAINDAGEATFVLMAVDKNGDGINAQNSSLDTGVPCPPYCGRP
jgi:hypothetical protein